MSHRPFDNKWARARFTPAERVEQREKLRRKLFEEQDGLCWLCNEPMTLERGDYENPNRRFASFDHVIPKHNGGTAYYTNLKLAHRSCNSIRGHKIIDT